MLELMQSIKPYFHCLEHFASFSLLLFIFWLSYRALFLQVQCCKAKGVGCLANSRSNCRIWSSDPGCLWLLDTNLDWLGLYP